MANKDPLWIDCIAGSQLKDTQGEMLSVEGADISELEAGRGRWNDNHGKGFFNSIGRITEAKKIFSEADCENERHKYYWEKVKSPFVYARGYLYDDEDHPNARAAAAILRNIHKSDIPLKIKASVEGGVVARGIKDPNLLARTKIHSVALTFTPANQATLVEPVSLQKSQWEEDEKLIKSVMHLAKTNVPSFRHITRHAQAQKVAENFKKINELVKANGLSTVIPEYTVDEWIKQAAGHKLAENVKKINEIIKNLSKARPNPITTPFYQIGEQGSESHYTGKDAIDAQKHVAKELIASKHRNGEAYKNMPNYETGKNELHFLVHRGLDQKANDTPGFNQFRVHDDHIEQPGNAVHTLSPHIAHEYTGSGENGEVHSFWVPISKANALAIHHNSGIKDKRISDSDIPEEYMYDEDKRFIDPHSEEQQHISIAPGKFRRATRSDLEELDRSQQHHVNEFLKDPKNKWYKMYAESDGSILKPHGEDHKFAFPEDNKKLTKMLSAGYGGAGAPTSRTGGSVIQSESLDAGRGFKYFVCPECGHEQIYAKNQVKCRECNRNIPLEKLYGLMVRSK